MTIKVKWSKCVILHTGGSKIKQLYASLAKHGHWLQSWAVKQWFMCYFFMSKLDIGLEMHVLLINS